MRALTPTLSRAYTGEGARGVIAILVLFLSSIASAQTVSSPTDGLYRPGRYMPLRIETSAAGLVRVRGPEVQGVDWPAPGPGSVVVPLMIYSDSVGELDLAVNDKPIKLPRRPMEASAAWPSGVEEIDPPRPGDPRLTAFNDAAYVPADRWRGGRSAQRREMLVYAAIAATLVTGALLLIPRRAIRTIASVAAAGVVCAFVVAAFRTTADTMCVVVSRPSPTGEAVFDWWTYLRCNIDRAERAIGTRLLIQSPDQLTQAAPVMVCDAAGKPDRIEFLLKANQPIAMLQMDGADPTRLKQIGEVTGSTALARWAYGRRATIRSDNVTMLAPPPTP